MRVGGLTGALLAAAAVAACSDAPPGALEPQLTGCSVAPGGPGGPVLDPNGPYYHQMALALTADGVTLTGPRVILQHASVPDGVRLPDGTVLVYYVNGAQGPTWIARLDADTAVVLGPLTVNGISGPAGIVDPDAYMAPDGKVRLAYLSGFGPPNSGTVRAICIAESTDGLSFTVLGRALTIASGEMLTDPSVVRLSDGTWRMAISLGQSTVMARSSDGLNFQRYDVLSFGGVPELAIAPNGRLRLYVCKGGIVSYVSADGGTTWQFEATVVPPNTLGKRILCDPSLVPGAGRFIFKTAD